ncbi:MAG TPA: NAD(+) synthase [Clostridiales bacterium]|nr:NAD(+) synthase [Clostridiales bacterium]
MKYGYVKVAAVTPKIEVANCEYNAEQVIKLIDQAAKEKVKVLVFPELCLTGYTCADLLLDDALIKSAEEKLIKIAEYTKGMDMLIALGLPFVRISNLYNVVAIIQDGKILGLVPKKHIPNHSDMNESRYFNSGNDKPVLVNVGDFQVPMGTNLLLRCKSRKELVISVEIGEDQLAPIPPAIKHAQKGSTIILNPSASPRTIGKDSYTRELLRMQSAGLISGYIKSDAGEGESTTDLVFSGHNIIAENGKILSESNFLYDKLLITEIDFDKLYNDRRRNSIYKLKENDDYVIVDFEFDGSKEITMLTRKVNPSAFIPDKLEDREERCEEILNIQAHGLKKRIEHIKIKHTVIGISGGLDSALALLATKKAYDIMGLDPKGIICVTMPCFGTTDRTYKNALDITKYVGATLREIPIEDAVIQHFKDIGHDINNHDITYENSQARERTQVLMDLANQCGGIVIGTGNMSELALGWATYNGDHMSMYAVNSTIPKTLVKCLVEYCADKTDKDELKEVLYDILDTPVSPELLPAVDGKIVQKTQEVVGPYELHDFFLYYVLRYGFMPSKILYLATIAFKDVYTEETIYKWLSYFYSRFFSQQFKRSCLPDGPKIGSITVSPRNGLKMPSDASARIWLEDLEKSKTNKS